jgi:endonuclease/exonuclease/phosphatase family metal-dependent hydrolase
VIIAGDFNDWRQRADALLEPCGLREVFAEHHGKPARSFPARLPACAWTASTYATSRPASQTC